MLTRYKLWFLFLAVFIPLFIGASQAKADIRKTIEERSQTVDELSTRLQNYIKNYKSNVYADNSVAANHLLDIHYGFCGTLEEAHSDINHAGIEYDNFFVMAPYQNVSDRFSQAVNGYYSLLKTVDEQVLSHFRGPLQTFFEEASRGIHKEDLLKPEHAFLILTILAIDPNKPFEPLHTGISQAQVIYNAQKKVADNYHLFPGLLKFYLTAPELSGNISPTEKMRELGYRLDLIGEIVKDYNGPDYLIICDAINRLAERSDLPQLFDEKFFDIYKAMVHNRLFVDNYNLWLRQAITKLHNREMKLRILTRLCRTYNGDDFKSLFRMAQTIPENETELQQVRKAFLANHALPEEIRSKVERMEFEAPTPAKKVTFG